MVESPVTMKEKVSFGLGAVGKDLGYAIMAAYVMIYFTDVVGVSPAFVGIVFLIARMWDAINDPIMGLIVDNTKTRWGKFRPWILSGAIVNAIVVVLLFTNPLEYFGFTMNQTMAYCAIMYILWGMTYTINDVSFWSCIPAFSSDSKVRDQMSVIPRTGAMFGNQFVVIFGLGMITFLGTGLGGTPSDGYFRYALFIGVLFVILSTICAVNIREHVQTPFRQKISFKDMFSLLLKNDQLLVIILLTVISQIAQNLVNGSILYYFKYVLSNEGIYTYFMAAGAVAQLCSYLTFTFVVGLTSRRMVYLLSCSLMIIGYLGMFIADTNIFLAGMFYCIACIGTAYLMVSTTVMLADTVDYGEYKLGTRSESIVFSMQTMTAKFGGAFAGFLSGLTLTIVGYVPNEVQTPETITGIRVVMFVASSVVLVVILALYVKFYKLHGDFYKNMLSALQVSRDNKKAEKDSVRFVRAALNEEAIFLDIEVNNKEELLRKMVHALVDIKELDAKDEEAFFNAVMAREAEAPTGIANGIALPHAKSELIKKTSLVIARLKKPIDFGAPDKKDCDLIFLLASVNDGNAHLNVIGRLGLILNDENNVKKIRGSYSNAYDLLEDISHMEREQLEH